MRTWTVPAACGAADMVRTTGDKDAETCPGFSAVPYDVIFFCPLFTRGDIPASRDRGLPIEPDFIKEASGGKGEFKKAEIAADADRTAAAWESGETRVEMLYIRSKSEAVIDFVSKRFERLAPTQPARSQNS